MKILNQKFNFTNSITNDTLIESIECISKGISNNIWGDAPRIVQDFTDHYQKHSLKILEILNVIIGNAKNKINLSEKEIYILTVSAFLHDIGLQCDLKKHIEVYNKLCNEHSGFKVNLDPHRNNYTDEEQAIIRKYHNFISVAWMDIAYYDNNERLNHCITTIPEKLLDDVKNVCKYHCKLPIEGVPCSTNCRLELLILLFRIADELDIGDHRCNQNVLDNYNIRLLNAMHWYINLRSEVKISEINDIIMTFSLSNKDFEKHSHIANKIINDFEIKNRSIMEKLREYNVMISFSHESSKAILVNTKDLPIDIINELYYYVFKVPYTTLIIEDDTNLSCSQNLSCYISFDSGSISKEYVKDIEKTINMYSNKTIVVNYYSKLRNKSFNSIKNYIDKTDCIIIITNDNYIQKIKTRESYCSCEYSAIKSRYDRIRYNEMKGINSNEKNCLFNIMTNDNNYAHSTKYLDDLKMHISIINISEYKQLSNSKENSKKNVTTLNVQSYFRNIFDKLVYDTFSISHSQTEKYKNFVTQMYHNFFINTREQMFVLPSQCFVKTNAYYDISSNMSYIIIGRKGSGKSTVIKTLSEINSEQYKGIIRINADDIPTYKFFNEYYTMNNLFTQKIVDMKKDVEEVFGLNKTLNIVWELFLYIYCLIILYDEFIMGKLNEIQSEYMRSALKDLYSKLPFINEIDSSSATSVLYTYSKSAVFEYAQKVINDSLSQNTNWEIVESKIISDFTFDKLLYNYFDLSSEKIILNSISEIVNQCSRRILITMDNFDTQFETLRTEQTIFSLNKAVDFEAKWLRSFLETIYTIRESTVMSSQAMLYKLFDFCLCIPHDRFSEFIRWNRDAYKYNYAVVDLYWSGVELAILLRKRLEYLYPDLRKKWKSKGMSRPEEILNFCLEEKFPQIPKAVTVRFEQYLKGEAKYIKKNIPLFQYVLRMSFWRPRDILEYYASIISFVSSYNDSENIDHNIMQEMVKKAIKTHSAQIIDNEFIREYESVIFNIRDIINGFDGCYQSLSWNDLSEILNNVDFLLYNSSKLSTVQKFSILYEIGFLGLFPTENYKETYAILHNHAFIFNERRYLLTGISSSEFFKCKFLIHPIFTERLKLIINIEDILCYYDWNYLHNIENLDKRQVNKLNK